MHGLKIYRVLRVVFFVARFAAFFLPTVFGIFFAVFFDPAVIVVLRIFISFDDCWRCLKFA